jgi:hypothetical protein
MVNPDSSVWIEEDRVNSVEGDDDRLSTLKFEENLFLKDRLFRFLVVLGRRDTSRIG